MDNVRDIIRSRINKNFELINAIEADGLPEDMKGTDLLDNFSRVAVDSIRKIAEVQIFNSSDMGTDAGEYLKGMRRGWLTVVDKNLARAFCRLPVSSSIFVSMNSNTGKYLVVALLADFAVRSIPLYIVSTSMGSVQIDEMLRTFSGPEENYITIRNSISRSGNISEFSDFTLDKEKSIVFFFMDSPFLGGTRMDLGHVDEIRRKFTPPNGYLFLVSNSEFFKDSPLLSYLNSSFVNNISIIERDNETLIDFTGFHSPKLNQLRVIDLMFARTAVMGRDFFV